MRLFNSSFDSPAPCAANASLSRIHLSTSASAASSSAINCCNSFSAGSLGLTIGIETPVCCWTRLLTACGWFVASSALKRPIVKSLTLKIYQFRKQKTELTEWTEFFERRSVQNLFFQLFADRLQFFRMLFCCFWKFHFQIFQRVEDDLRDDEARVDFIVRRNDKPRRVFCARRAEAFFVGGHVLLPKIPLLDVIAAELPVFLRIVNARKKAFPLFLFGDVQEKFHNARAITMQMLFQVQNGIEPRIPDIFPVKQFAGNVFRL